MTRGKAEAGRIRLERVFAGPVEDLWALWTTKEAFEEWFAPAGCRVEVPVLELRTGGSFDHVMTAVADEQLAEVARLGLPSSTRARGRFVEVVLHRRLHIRYTIDFVPGAEPHPYDIVVDFQPEGEHVRMVVTADQHLDPEYTRIASETLTAQMQKFEAVLASTRKAANRG